MRNYLLISLVLLPFLSSGQIDYAYQTFDDFRIVNGHSVETNTEGILTFIISHRFGTINSGFGEMFGLDNASMRIGFDYGITNNLSIGIGRTSDLDKPIDGYIKYKLLAQSSGDRVMPFTLTFLGTTALRTQEASGNTELNFQQKLAYTGQLLIARKFGSKLSLQLMPTFLHRNLVANDEENDILSLGVAGQYQFLKNWSFSVEYYATPPSYLPDGETGPSPQYYQSLAVGFQIDTKGHVFQLHFGNSRGMIEKYFIAETFDSWLDGGIHFGFNITRDFTIKGRKIR